MWAAHPPDELAANGRPPPVLVVKALDPPVPALPTPRRLRLRGTGGSRGRRPCRGGHGSGPSTYVRRRERAPGRPAVRSTPPGHVLIVLPCRWPHVWLSRPVPAPAPPAACPPTAGPRRVQY